MGGGPETLAELAAGFSRADFSDEDVSTEAIHALSECLLDLEGKLNQIRPEQDVLLTSAVRLRLAFDALSHPNQPLWQGVTRKWCGTSEAVERAVQSGSREKVREAVDRAVRRVPVDPPRPGGVQIAPDDGQGGFGDRLYPHQVRPAPRWIAGSLRKG